MTPRRASQRSIWRGIGRCARPARRTCWWTRARKASGPPATSRARYTWARASSSAISRPRCRTGHEAGVVLRRRIPLRAGGRQFAADGLHERDLPRWRMARAQGVRAGAGDIGGIRLRLVHPSEARTRRLRAPGAEPVTAPPRVARFKQNPDILPAAAPVYASDRTVRPTSGRLLLRAPRDLLHFAHHAQRVAAQNFEDVLIGEAALHQAATQVGRFGDVLHAFGKQVVRPVEIGAKPDVVHTRHFNGC